MEAGTTIEWADATIAGFRAMGLSDHNAAAGHWLGAREALCHAAPQDPRHAACQSNAGAAHILLRQPAYAEAALSEAELRWMRLSSAIGTAEISLPGRSSAFHFKLAAENLDAFQNAQRRRLARLCEAGLAMTRFNRLLASADIAASEAVMPMLAAQLSDALGAQSPEVRLLLGVAFGTEPADSLYADKAAAFDARTASAAPDDQWLRLEAAVALTALLHPGLHPDAQTDAHSEFPTAVRSSSMR